MTESRKFNRNTHKAYHDAQLAGLLSILEQVVDVNMTQEDRRKQYTAITQKGTPRGLLRTIHAWSNEISGYLRKYQPVMRMNRNDDDERIEDPDSWTDVLLVRVNDFHAELLYVTETNELWNTDRDTVIARLETGYEFGVQSYLELLLHMFDVPRKESDKGYSSHIIKDFYPAGKETHLPSYKDTDNRRRYYQESSDVMELVRDCAMLILQHNRLFSPILEVIVDPRAVKLTKDLKAMQSARMKHEWTQEDYIDFARWRLEPSPPAPAGGGWGTQRILKRPRTDTPTPTPTPTPTHTPTPKRMATLLSKLASL